MMSADTLCRVCLISNLKLYSIGNDLKIIYERMTSEKYNKVGYPVSMCYICLSVLHKSRKFIETAQDANNVLEQWCYQQNEMGVAKPLSTYSMTTVELASIGHEDILTEDEIKVESVQEDIESDCIEYEADIQTEKLDYTDEEIVECDLKLTFSPESDNANDANDDERQTDALFNNIMNIKNSEVHTNVGKKRKLHDNDCIEYEADIQTEKLDYTDEEIVECDLKLTFSPESDNANDANDDERQTDALFNNIMNIKNSEVHTNVGKKRKLHDNDCIEYEADIQTEKLDYTDEEIDECDLKLTFSPESDNANDANDDERQTDALFNNIMDIKNSEVHTNVGKKRKLHDNDCIEYEADIQTEKLDYTDEEIDECDLKLTFSPESDNANDANDDERQTDALFNNIMDIKNSEVHTNVGKKRKLHDNDKSQIYEEIESTLEVKAEIDTNDEIQLIRAIKMSNEFNTEVKIEAIDESCTEFFDMDEISPTEASNIIFNQNIQESKPKNKQNVKTLHICDICDETFTFLNNLKRHFIRKHTPKTTADTKNKLKQDNYTFSCDQCFYKCNSQSSIYNHKKFHTNEVFTCDICGYKCAKKSNFDRHLKSHSGEKPFPCDICNVKCTTKRGLKLHLRTHTGERPFSCKFCDQGFVASSDLTKHLRIHTGEKPYSCGECGYRFTRLYHLKNHMKKHQR